MTKKSIVLQQDMASEAYFSPAIFDWSDGTMFSIYLSGCGPIFIDKIGCNGFPFPYFNVERATMKKI